MYNSTFKKSVIKDELDNDVKYEINYTRNILNINLKILIANKTQIEIYDFSGKKITLYELGYLEAGSHTIKKPITLSSGVYFAVLKFGNQSISKQFEVVR